jgi:hypothetical protein
MKTLMSALAAVALLLAGVAGSSAEGGERGGAPSARDRQSILAMAGNYRVRFDFRETTPFVDDYNPIESKITAGFEAVRVIEDRPGRISLQHLLVVEDDGKPFVVKHWRQDWVWEPATVLVYTAANQWKLRTVPAAERKGAWSQTVWQTDDSPRYGGVGRWVYSDGVARWTSDETRRPLARRDAIRKPPYGWYMGTNRHALTPEGWVHEQDNAKVGLRAGKPTTFVHETVTNTYSRSDRFQARAADAYWEKTKGYWAEVRATWDRTIARNGGVRVTEEADNGTVIGPKLMDLADDIADGKIDTAKALAEARTAIAGETRTRLAAR